MSGRRPRLVAVALVAVMALSACGGDTRGEIRKVVGEITVDANAGNADGVRSGVDTLLVEVDDALRSGELTSAEAARITELARLLRERADLLEQPEEVSPTTASPSPTQSPTPSPTASPTSSPTASPTPSPTRTEEPTPSPTSTDDGIIPTLPG